MQSILQIQWKVRRDKHEPDRWRWTPLGQRPIWPWRWTRIPFLPADKPRHLAVLLWSPWRDGAGRSRCPPCRPVPSWLRWAHRWPAWPSEVPIRRTGPAVCWPVTSSDCRRSPRRRSFSTGSATRCSRCPPSLSANPRSSNRWLWLRWEDQWPTPVSKATARILRKPISDNISLDQVKSPSFRIWSTTSLQIY